MSPELRDAYEIVHAAVQQDGRALEFASDILRMDERIVETAARQDPHALEFAELEPSYEVVREALEEMPELYDPSGAFCGGTKNPIPDQFYENPEIVSMAVKYNGLYLEFASEDLKNDVDIVRQAVKEDGRALQFASETLRDTPIVVATAIQSWRTLPQDAVVETVNLGADIVDGILQHTGKRLQKELKSAMEFLRSRCEHKFDFTDAESMCFGSVTVPQFDFASLVICENVCTGEEIGTAATNYANTLLKKGCWKSIWLLKNVLPTSVWDLCSKKIVAYVGIKDEFSSINRVLALAPVFVALAWHSISMDDLHLQKITH